MDAVRRSELIAYPREIDGYLLSYGSTSYARNLLCRNNHSIDKVLKLCKTPGYHIHLLSIIMRYHHVRYVCGNFFNKAPNDTAIRMNSGWLAENSFRPYPGHGWVTPACIDDSVLMMQRRYLKKPEYHTDLMAPIIAVVGLIVLNATIVRGYRSFFANFAHAGRFLIGQSLDIPKHYRLLWLPLEILGIYYVSLCENIVLSNTIATLGFPFSSAEDLAKQIAAGQLKPIQVKSNLEDNSASGLVEAHGFSPDGINYAMVKRHGNDRETEILNQDRDAFDVHTRRFYAVRKKYYNPMISAWDFNMLVVDAYRIASSKREIDLLNVLAWETVEFGFQKHFKLRYYYGQQARADPTPRNQPLAINLWEFAHVYAAVVFFAVVNVSIEVVMHHGVNA